jgi:phosphatidylglycerophosphate synthase
LRLRIAMAKVPWMLVGLRFAIAPLLLIDALDGRTGVMFMLGYVAAVLSDIFDGIIARRLGVSTINLRKADSWADIGLYLCIAVSVWLVYPAVILDFKVPLLIAIAFQLSLFTISLVKFGQFPSFHTYTAKAWGASLFFAVVLLFGFGSAMALWGAIGLCLINSIEEIAMTAILPQWTHDVLSLSHALKLRDRLSAKP